jgi:hypothetical protein
MKTIKLILLILWALILVVFGFPANFRWNANPPAEAVTKYRIYQLPTEGPRILKATIPATAEPKQLSGPLDVESGQRFVVTAYNGTFESEPSDPVTVPVKPSKPGAVEVVEIEVSANMTDWEPVALVPLKTDDPARFIRTRIITVTPNSP